MGSNAGPKIPQVNNIALNIDFLNKKCYPGSGLTVVCQFTGIAGTAVNIASPTTVGGGTTLAFQTFASNQYLNFGAPSGLDVTPSVTMNTFTILRSYNVANMTVMSKTSNGYRYGLSGSEGWYTTTAAAALGASANAAFSTGIATTHALNVWVMTTSVFNQATGIIKFYNNGIATTQSFGTGRWSALGITASNFEIGNELPNNNVGWNGSIAIAQIFNGALSDNEVLNLFNAFKGRFSL